MIHWVCEMFGPDDEFVFIIQEEHNANPSYRQILEAAVAKSTIIGIKPHNLGPIPTSLAAEGVVADDEPVIFSYCDLFQHWNYRHFLWRVADYDGGIAVFKGFHPASFGDTYYAYLRINDKNEMLELREKQSFTNQRHKEPASSGVYYIRSWSLFRRFAHKVLQEKLAVGSEHYLSLIYNPMVAENLQVITYEIDKFICWGTPEDVEQYRFWSDFFAKDAPIIINRRILQP